MKPWIEKAKAANAKALDAVELFSIAGQKSVEEQRKTIEAAFKKYQQAWIESMEGFSDGLKEYGEA